MKHANILAIIITFIMLSFPLVSSAGLILTITKTDSSHGVLTASGTSDYNSSSMPSITLINAIETTAPKSAIITSNSLQIGSSVLTDMTSTSSVILYLNFDAPWSLGDIFSGSADIDLNGATWSSGFTSGDIEMFDAGFTMQTGGSWAMVEPSPIPESSVFALMGLGLLGFAATRRKSQKNLLNPLP